MITSIRIQGMVEGSASARPGLAIVLQVLGVRLVAALLMVRAIGDVAVIVVVVMVVLVEILGTRS